MPLPLHSILADKILLKITPCKGTNACFLWSWVLASILAGVIGDRYVAGVLLLRAACCLLAWVFREDSCRKYASTKLILDCHPCKGLLSRIWFRRKECLPAIA